MVVARFLFYAPVQLLFFFHPLNGIIKLFNKSNRADVFMFKIVGEYEVATEKTACIKE